MNLIKVITLSSLVCTTSLTMDANAYNSSSGWVKQKTTSRSAYDSRGYTGRNDSVFVKVRGGAIFRVKLESTYEGLMAQIKEGINAVPEAKSAGLDLDAVKIWTAPRSGLGKEVKDDATAAALKANSTIVVGN